MKMYHESENPHFSCIFLNVHILLIIAHIYLKTCMCTAKICMEGSMSQNFDLGLSFCFMLCRRWNIEIKYKKITKVTRLLS